MPLSEDELLALDAATVEILLCDAEPTDSERKADPDGTEGKRVTAVRKLLKLYRWSAGQNPRLRRKLGRFFRERWNYILSNAQVDPAEAVQELFHGRAEKGRPAVPIGENLEIAVRVQRYINAGSQTGKAFEQVASEGPRSGSATTIRDIYYGPTDEAGREKWRLLVRLAATFI